MKNIFLTVLTVLILVGSTFAGTVTGQIQTPSTGRGVPNSTLTFTLTQAAVISGTAAVAANANCWTDSSGNVVGLPGDAAIAAPALSSNTGSGSLGSGTYFVRYTWANATGESQPSVERSLALSSAGTLVVQAPVNVPAMATSMKVYIGTAAGTESLQGSVAVTNGVLAGNYIQAVALVAGAALPASNTSACQIRFNDELQPSFTGYSVAFTNVNGAGIVGFPQKWSLSGGSNGTVNLSQGTPLYSGVVQYPQAILASPAANGQQSINGPLNLNGFTLTAGNLVLTGNLACDGVTDDTAALNAALAVLNNTGGGQLVLPPNKTCKIAGQVTLPNDGGTPVPKQKAIAIRGSAAGGVMQNGGITNTCNGGTILNMTFNSPTGKIDTRGLGRLAISGICFQDSNTDGTPFIFTTNTILDIQGNQFQGNTTSLNDGIILGSQGIVSDGSANAVFQGYGTLIQGNQADYIKRFAVLGNEANSINIVNNHVFNHSSNPTGGFIEINPGTPGATHLASGNVITGNLLDGQAKYPIYLVQNAINNFIGYNQCWDAGPANTNCIFEASSASNSGNLVIDINPNLVLGSTPGAPSQVTTSSSMWTNNGFRAPVGDSGHPSYTFSGWGNGIGSGARQGLYAFGGALVVRGNCDIGTACGSHMFNDVSHGFHQPSDATITWDATTNVEALATDTQISRASAGVIAIGNAASPGNAGGTLKAAAINGASLVGAGNGNTVSLLNQQGIGSAITGNGADQTLFSYTIPANTI